MKLLFTFCLFLTPLLAADPVLVRVVSMEEVAFFPAYEAPARVVANNEALIAAEVIAPVHKVLVKPGDTVAKGETLVKLDARDYEYQMLSAIGEKEATEAQLDLALLEEQRFKRLFEQKTVSDSEYMAKLNEYKALLARIKARLAEMNAAKLRWQKCEIRAPFDGVVTERFVSVGELTQIGSSLVTLVETDDPMILADLPSNRAFTVPGSESIELVAGGKRYPLTFRTLSPVVTAATRTIAARFEFAGPKAPAGLTGRLEWRINRQALPAHLIVSRNQELGVMLAENDRAIFHPIAHATEGSPAVVNLPTDAKIIAEGRLGLAHEDAIKIQ